MNNQTFTVIYKSNQILVDPIKLSNASIRFRELYQPFQNAAPNTVHLDILYDEFTQRNIENFLKLCQNLPTDVLDTEMKEVCEIAKMFEAEQIYQTGVNFIRQNIDPNFYVPDHKYDNSPQQTYLFMESEGTQIHHVDTFSELEFTRSSEGTSNVQTSACEFQNNNYTQSQPLQSTSIAAQYDPRGYASQQANYRAPGESPIAQQREPEYKENDIASNYGIMDNDQLPQEFGDSEDDQKMNTIEDHATKQKAMNILNSEPKGSSVVYQIQIQCPFAKCPRYVCSKGGLVIMTAKQRYGEIVLGQGSEVHINKNIKNHIGHISQETEGINIVHLKDQSFTIKFVTSEKPYYTSMKVSFVHNGNKLTWKPRAPYYNAKTNKYYISLHGEYHHYAIKSRRNTVLQNQAGHTTFIVRKMQKNLYEVECHQSVDPALALSLGISQVIGPYSDPLSFFE